MLGYKLKILRYILLLITLLCSTCAPQTKPSIDQVAVHHVVVDEIGRSVEVVTKPQRIISLAPNITEMLFALGLGKSIVGVTTYCNYPPEAQAIAKVSDTLHPNLEQIIALKPDLVIVSTASQLEQFITKLTEAKIPIFVIKSQSLAGIIHSLESLGQVTGAETTSQAVVAQMRQRLVAISQVIKDQPRPKVFLIVGTEPLITAGKGAFITDLIDLAGADSISANVAAEWPAYSAETVVSQAPDIILMPGGHSNDAPMPVPEVLQTTPAARNKRVYQIEGDLILRPGPRILDGLAQMVKLFHPEAH